VLRIIIKFFSLHSNLSHLMSFSLTFQNSLSVHILLNYSNFINTIALLKCIIKRTMLTLTDTFHSVWQFRDNSSWKLIHLTWWTISLFLTFQNSLQFHILSNYSNFIDTVALLKCIIKRTMLTLTDNVHSIRKLKVYCKLKSWWKLIRWDQRTLQATEQWSCNHIQTTTQTKTIQCLKKSEWDQQSSDERQCKRRDRTRAKEQRYSW